MSAGNYHLPSGGTETLTDTVNIAEGAEVRLCLNGRTVTVPDGKPVFKVPGGSTLYLSACSSKSLQELTGNGTVQVDQGGTLVLIENKSQNDSSYTPRTITGPFSGDLSTPVDPGPGPDTPTGHQDHDGVHFDRTFDKSTPGALSPDGPIHGSLPIHPELYYDLPAGNYYMTDDVQMEYAMEVHDTTNFCLFDHDLTAYNETWEYDMDHVFWVPDKSVLSVYDCQCNLKIVWLYGGSVHLRGSGKVNLVGKDDYRITMELEDGADGGTFAFKDDTGDVALPPHSVVTQNSGGKNTVISHDGDRVVIAPSSGGKPAAALDLPQGNPPVLLTAPETPAEQLTLELPSGTSIQAQTAPDAHVVLNSQGTIDTAGIITAEKVTVSAPDKQEAAAVIAAPEDETLEASIDGTVDLPAGSTVTTGKITLELKSDGDSPAPTGGTFKAGGEIAFAPGSEIAATITETNPSGGTNSRTIVIALPGTGGDPAEDLRLVDGGIGLPGKTEITVTTKDGKTIVIALPYPPDGGDVPVWFDEENKIILPEGTKITEAGPDGTEKETTTTPENNTLDPDTGGLTKTDPEDIPNMPGEKPDNPDNPDKPDQPTPLPSDRPVITENGTKIEQTGDNTITITPPGEEEPVTITLPEQKPGDPDPVPPKTDKDGNVYIEGPFAVKTDDEQPKITITPPSAGTPETPVEPVKVKPDGKVELPGGSKVSIPQQEGKAPIVVTLPEDGGTIDLKPEDGKIPLPPGATVTVDGKKQTIGNDSGSIDLSTGEITGAVQDDPPPQPGTPSTPSTPGGSGKPSKPSKPSEPAGPQTPGGESAGPCPRDETCPIWPYTDAVPTAWYHDGVHYCIEEDLMIGTAPALFEPDIPLTRAMVTQVLYNRAGCPQVSGKDPFTDVKSGAWYWPAITWAAKEGIALGYGDGRFGPNDPVTREQLAALLWRDAGRPASQYVLPFSDAHRISDYAVPALRWTTERKIVNGYPDGTFLPQGNATRAEAAQMFYRYFNR